ncbi:DUF1232 domain-containing protein|uniref:DUF1232 domain-containing protein n=1 Tax=Dendrosporobacter quercicolus TaxID=146817 RepID=A0A1G9U6F1_9FIRM|nr:DUF1232 domain-containing protein [Dendrosporobacter quercicolus]NSL48742.1 DUF1232 domain-containing protein [Dendrosporobacter quercicolus DSM 1736]SDM55442.1 Protein of unknown function [Dendrosporobacter quercicolus]
MSGFVHRLPLWLKALKDDAIVLYYAWKHPQTPAYIKGLMLAVLVYVFSPIDVIPDYLLFLGITDDALLLPTAVIYLSRLLPDAVRAECYSSSLRWRNRLPWLLGLLVVALIGWLTLCLLGIAYLVAK